jgi:hypothetical protein
MLQFPHPGLTAENDRKGVVMEDHNVDQYRIHGWVQNREPFLESILPCPICSVRPASVGVYMLQLTWIDIARNNRL